MVSRSADGELLSPSLRLRRVVAVRGSTREGDRDMGGGAALQELARRMGPDSPDCLAADGGTLAMVSRSAFGELLIPSLLLRGVVPVRCSTPAGDGDKGGGAALQELARRMGADSPAYFAADGPLGPRGHLHRGPFVLA